MKKTIKISALLLLIITTIFSCRKEQELVPPISGKKQFALKSLFKNLEPQRQTFTINAASYQVVTGNQGTRILIPSGSLKRANGQTVTSGSIQIELMEMLEGGQMIKANKTTTSGGRTLISGGQVYLMARQNGEELQVNSSNPPVMQIPTNNPQPMQLFNGTLNPSDSIDGDSIVDWTPVDTVTNPVVVTQDSSVGGLIYEFSLDSIGFINCDYFYGSGQPLTSINVTTPSAHVDSNTAVFIYFPSINSVARLWGFDESTNTFSLGAGYQCPIGISAKIVVISQIGSQYYLQVIPITVSSNMTVTSNPSAVSEADIEAALDNL